VNQITFTNTALMTAPASGSVYVSKFSHETGHDQSEITGHDNSEMTGHATETPGHVGLKYAHLSNLFSFAEPLLLFVDD